MKNRLSGVIAYFTGSINKYISLPTEKLGICSAVYQLYCIKVFFSIDFKRKCKEFFEKIVLFSHSKLNIPFLFWNTTNVTKNF